MTSRQGRQAIAATAAMGVAVALALPTAAFAQSATQGKETATTTSSGTTYYVSSAHGDDANAGTSTLQSERYFAALKALGAPARLVILPNENHRYAARESVLHALWEQDQWLEKYAK